MTGLELWLMRIGIGLAIVAASWVGGCTHERVSNAEELAEAQGRADAIQAGWDKDSARIRKESDNEKAAIAAERDDALDRLRDRAPRMSESSRAACKGTTGQELAKDDGEFLTRQAAEAAAQQSALKECYAWIDAVTSR